MNTKTKTRHSTVSSTVPGLAARFFPTPHLFKVRRQGLESVTFVSSLSNRVAYLGPVRLTARRVAPPVLGLTGWRNLRGLADCRSHRLIIPRSSSRSTRFTGFTPLPAEPCQQAAEQYTRHSRPTLHLKASRLSGTGPSFLSRFVLFIRLGSIALYPSPGCPAFRRAVITDLAAADQLTRCDYRGCTRPPSGTGGNPPECVPDASPGLRLTTPCPATHLCATVYSGSPPRYRNPPQPSARRCSRGFEPPVPRRTDTSSSQPPFCGGHYKGHVPGHFLQDWPFVPGGDFRLLPRYCCGLISITIR